ncbi:AAA family ATPase [Nocardia sp. NPDC052278]|uniref:helix-turn-helix transcriptional regulator n=1 Tax=unclassified Nocardia TaxID=2637762 RepID=UPI0036AB4469
MPSGLVARSVDRADAYRRRSMYGSAHGRVGRLHSGGCRSGLITAVRVGSDGLRLGKRNMTSAITPDDTPLPAGQGPSAVFARAPGRPGTTISLPQVSRLPRRPSAVSPVARPGRWGGRAEEPLHGREAELQLVSDLIDRGLARMGDALLVRGDIGIGKTALLGVARDLVTARGGRAMSVVGVQSEALVPYAGLHRLFRPMLGHTMFLIPHHRQALLTALGMAVGAAPEMFSVGLAALELISAFAEDTPVMLTIDDAQWIDRASSEVLAFVANRLNTERAVMMLAVRAGHDTVLDDAGLPELPLTELDDAAASALLAECVPELGYRARARILIEAAGNPLALIELPRSLRDSDAGQATPWLPMTRRLERSFLARVSVLSDTAQTLLLIAAADDECGTSEILGAAGLLDGTELSVDVLEPAVAAGLIEIDGHEVGFRHPLIRSAIYQAATPSRRLAAHAALARVLTDRQERRAWHRAAASPGPDDDVALDLEVAARKALDRGAPHAAATALRRAASLSSLDTVRGRLLLRSAEIDFELGDLAEARRQLDEANCANLDEGERLRLTLWTAALDEDSWYRPERVRAIADMAHRLAGAERDGATLSLRALWQLSIGCWYSNPTPETRALVVGTARRLRRSDSDPMVLSIAACAAPAEEAAWVIGTVRANTPRATGDPTEQHALGASLTAIWAFDLAWPFLCAAVGGLRKQGRLGLLGEALASQAWAALILGKTRLAATAADEAGRLSRDTGRPRWALVADLVTAMLAGERGDYETANDLVCAAEAELLSTGAQSLLGFVQFVRGRLALLVKAPDDAFEHLARVLDPFDIAYHPSVGYWGIADLIEAGILIGRDDEVRHYLAQLDALAERTTSSYLLAMATYAHALLAADNDDAEHVYRQALHTQLSSWPLHRARLLLAHGRFLRRRRRLTDSRSRLRAAVKGFDALGTKAFGEEARAELRAAGEVVARSAPDSLDRLTPQESQIAKLAASGMSNREIGTRLFLSHRTVGNHLYRIFPKLGITSRGQLHMIDLGEDP